jgi:hypothetical protein
MTDELRAVNDRPIHKCLAQSYFIVFHSKLIQTNLSHMSHLSHLSHITYSPLSASTPMGLPIITTDDLLMRIWFGLILTYNKTPLFYKTTLFSSEITTLFRVTPVIPVFYPMPCLDKAASPAAVSKGIAADVFWRWGGGMDVACSAD